MYTVVSLYTHVRMLTHRPAFSLGVLHPPIVQIYPPISVSEAAAPPIRVIACTADLYSKLLPNSYTHASTQKHYCPYTLIHTCPYINTQTDNRCTSHTHTHLSTLHTGDVATILQLHPVGLVQLGPNEEVEVLNFVVLPH